MDRRAQRRGRARRIGWPGQGPSTKAWETSWERHRSRRWVAFVLTGCVLAVAVLAGLLMENVPHGAGFPTGLLVGLVLGGGLGVTAWAVLGQDGSHKWRLGALGEEYSWLELRKLGRDWTVLHSLSLPAADGTHREMDHVAVGPAGVLVIDSKLRTGNPESLNRISTSLDWDLRSVERQAGVLRLRLGQHPDTALAASSVVANLMVWGADVESAEDGVKVTRNGTWIVHGRDARVWRDRVATLPHRLSPKTRHELIELLRPHCAKSGRWRRFRAAVGQPAH